jgi:hypothetical protein
MSLEFSKRQIWFFVAVVSVLCNVGLLLSKNRTTDVNNSTVSLGQAYERTLNSSTTDQIQDSNVVSVKNVPHVVSGEIGVLYEPYDIQNELGPQGHVIKIYLPNDLATSSLKNNLRLLAGSKIGSYGFSYAGMRDSLVLVKQQNTLQVQQEIYDEKNVKIGTSKPLINMILPSNVQLKLLSEQSAEHVE